MSTKTDTYNKRSLVEFAKLIADSSITDEKMALHEIRPRGTSRIAAGMAKGQLSPPGTSPFSFDPSGALKPAVVSIDGKDEPIFMEFDQSPILPGGGLITPAQPQAEPEPEPPKEGYGDW